MRSPSSDMAYDWIRKRIVSGQFPPGHPLVADALAAEIGVSRTPVREALRMLEADGLVVIEGGMGASVKKMHLKEFIDLCEVRLALETQAAAMAALRRTDSELEEIRSALDVMRVLTERGERDPDEQSVVRELSREDLRFHIGILTAAKNELLKSEILRLHLIYRIACPPPVSERLVRVERDKRIALRQRVQAAHEAIHAAIAAGNAAGAREAMEQHIQSLIDAVAQTLARAEAGLIARELTPEELVYRV